MKAKIRLRGLLCHLKKLLNKPKVLVTTILIIYMCGLYIGVNAQQTVQKQRTISGTVVSATDHKPIEGVLIKATASAKSGALTDKLGNFELKVSENYEGRLNVALIGFETLRFPFTASSTNLKIILQPIKDPFLNINPDFEPLKIGEKVPDFSFALKNYKTPTAKISDFKGKLLIFDFWTTYCAPCIGSLPTMEKLQKQYGDKIQIILVNVRENEDEIKSLLKNSVFPHQQLYTMPSIIRNKALDQLFPHEFAGNYVWIDMDGILRMSSGISYNNNVEKINDVLAGKEISFLKEGKTYNKGEKTLTQLILDSTIKYPELGSIFTSVHKDYYPASGQVLNDIDSCSRTIRNTHVNQTILSLFNYTLDEEIKNDWETRIYGPNFGTNSFLDHFLLLVKDSTFYDNRFIPKGKETDVNMIQSLFCYEQILPLYASRECEMEFMYADLVRFFGLKRDITVAIEEISIPCYFIKLVNYKPISEKEIRKQLKHLEKREYITLQSLESVIDYYYRPTNHDRIGPWIPYVFDITKVENKKEIIMPVWKTGDKLEDFILALNANGLEFMKGEKKMKKFVIRENQ